MGNPCTEYRVHIDLCIIHESKLYSYSEDISDNSKIKFPIVVKPVNEGSSLGVKICKNKNYLHNVTKNLFKK